MRELKYGDIFNYIISIKITQKSSLCFPMHRYLKYDLDIIAISLFHISAKLKTTQKV